MALTRTAKASIKDKAIKLIKDLPAKASWDDVMYELYVRQKIEAGLTDIRSGRVHSHDSIKEEFGVT